jgi:hypothetical protein
MFQCPLIKCVAYELGEVHITPYFENVCLNMAPVFSSPKYFNVFSTNIRMRYSVYQSPVFHLNFPRTCAKYEVPTHVFSVPTKR